MSALITVGLAHLEQRDLVAAVERDRRHRQRRHTYDEISGRPPDLSRTALPWALRTFTNRSR
ncbi:hypothetical protein [Cellulomonas composti]|uniref:Uncharacterized protein n=1 Tax=Cellulomonas composti TaxID=266130 RepID=A0A511J9S9_9CELL|nr:hypothetical protein [Cellulomonas composti]GEL94744.1 hypothetical protein CCO02nite_14020 [Cellulomonas composti]